MDTCGGTIRATRIRTKIDVLEREAHKHQRVGGQDGQDHLDGGRPPRVTMVLFRKNCAERAPWSWPCGSSPGSGLAGSTFRSMVTISPGCLNELSTIHSRGRKTTRTATVSGHVAGSDCPDQVGAGERPLAGGTASDVRRGSGWSGGGSGSRVVHLLVRRTAAAAR